MPEYGSYKEIGQQARRNAEEYLRDEWKIDLRITGFDAITSESLWPKERFSWDDVIRRDFGGVQLDVAIWIGGVLEILAVSTGQGSSVIVRHIEGRPAGNAAVEGQRFWFILEVVANFASALGKDQIWWHPETDEFLTYCVQKMGAEQVGKHCRVRIPP